MPTPSDQLGTQLNFRNIALLDNGKIELVMNHALRSVIADVQARPADKGARSVMLKITARPSLDETTAALDTIAVTCEVSTKTPTRRNARPYKVLPMRDGTAVFQPQSPDDPRQQPLFRPVADTPPIDTTEDAAPGGGLDDEVTET